MAIVDLVESAPDDLPQHLKEHLPQAALRAEANAAHAQARFAADFVVLRRQLRSLTTAKVPSAGRGIRLRHLAAEWSRMVSTAAACRRGCSHCCHIDVLLPRSEAMLIGKAIGVMPVEPARTHRVEQASAVQDFVGTPCPFLEQGRCGIYGQRPTVCRLLVNLDDSELLCELVPNMQVPVPYANSTEIKALFVLLHLQEDFADVREWFPAGRARP